MCPGIGPSIWKQKIAERGVVFFREQQDLTQAEQRILVDRLGRETGRPKESGLHVHPIANATNELGGANDEVFKITGESCVLAVGC